jgi:hypothetical protein
MKPLEAGSTCVAVTVNTVVLSDELFQLLLHLRNLTLCDPFSSHHLCNLLLIRFWVFDRCLLILPAFLFFLHGILSFNSQVASRCREISDLRLHYLPLIDLLPVHLTTHLSDSTRDHHPGVPFNQSLHGCLTLHVMRGR